MKFSMLYPIALILRALLSTVEAAKKSVRDFEKVQKQKKGQQNLHEPCESDVLNVKMHCKEGLECKFLNDKGVGKVCQEGGSKGEQRAKKKGFKKSEDKRREKAKRRAKSEKKLKERM
jgi:hypothetical protein